MKILKILLGVCRSPNIKGSQKDVLRLISKYEMGLHS